MFARPRGHSGDGIDARGRKQYRYHPIHRQRSTSKFAADEFGKALPKLRRRVERDLKGRKMSRETVLAAIVRLLDVGYIRVGNEQYARDNKSYGATTLRSRHLRRKGSKLLMRFTGKHGIVHELTLTDSHLKRIVGRCQELPGQMLFQYVNGDGEARPVTSSDVNDYIKESTGDDFTAKHFRTWGASVIAMDQMLKKAEMPDHGQDDDRTRREALVNTEAMSRKSYVHPRLIDAVKEDARDPLKGMERPRARTRLSSSEVALLQYLSKRARRRRAQA